MRITHSAVVRALLGAFGLAAATMLATGPAAAQQRTEIVPYLEAQQVLSVDLGDGDAVTYTSLAAGVDGRITTRRVQAQASYRYERRIAWEGDLADDDIHSGIAQLRAELVPDALALHAGALATRARSNGSGPIIGFATADSRSLADVYSVYAGPDFSSRIGALDVAASYRLGYVKVDDHSLAGLPRVPGAPLLDRYNSSVNHTANFSVGMGPGELPVGWTVSGGYAREDVDRLDQEYEGRFIRGDVILPVSPTLAVTAGVGYEEIESSQQDIRRGPDGLPLTTPGGNFIPDPSRPRLIAYDQSGVIWDAGVIWRPSRRTEVQARLGRRYGDMTYTGSIQHKISAAYALTGSVFDTVDSFGRVIVADLAGAPVNFRVGRNPFNPGVGGIGGCVFGNDPGTGVCLDEAFGAIRTATTRTRGANILFSGGRGPWSLGIGASYAQRKYFAPDVAEGFGLNRFEDENFTVSASISRALSRQSGITVDGYASWFDPSGSEADALFGAGVSASYYQRLFYDRLQAQAGLGFFHTDADPEDVSAAQALLGLRYSF